MISQQKIKSPLTGGDAFYQKEMRETEFRGEKFVYEHHNILDLETNLEFTNTEIDEGNIQRVYSQYRAKHGIPSPKELTETRERYGLSAAKMSEILGLGTNQYRLYEEGQMPSEAIGKILKSIQEPAVFLGYIEGCKNQMSPEDYEKLCLKINKSFINEIKRRKNVSWFREFFSVGGFARKVAL